MDSHSKSIRNGQCHAIEQGIVNKSLNPNALDSQGGSLLQQAVYYNRRQLVTTLVENGADIMHSGGELQESPLYIAIQEKHYGMIELLVTFNRSVLDTLSRDGCTPIDVAYKIKDFNTMLLLLSLGADPNGCDKAGCPVLISILKIDASHEVMPFILLLLKSGANPSKCDEDGNNAFHTLAFNKKANLYLAFELFRASPAGANARNGFQNQIPYDLCSTNGNVKMGRFFFDALFFNRTPFLFPVVLMAAYLCVTFEALHRWGYLHAGVLAFFMSIFLRPLMQSSIVCYRDRNDMGVSLGFTIAWIISFIRDLGPHVSVTLFNLEVGSAVITLLLTLLFLFKKPEYGLKKKEFDQETLIRRIVSLSPEEGTKAEQGISIPNKRSQKPLFACTTCLTDSLDTFQFVSHCKACRQCVVDKDVHVTFLGNCSGQGNRRLFVLITLFSVITFTLYLRSSLLTYASLCPTAKGILWDIIALETCVAYNHPDLFWLGLMAVLSLTFFASILSQELRFISLNSSISHANLVNLAGNHTLRREYLDAVSTSVCVQRICSFLCTGRHSVSTRRPSSSSKKLNYIGTADAEDSDSELIALEEHASSLPGADLFDNRGAFMGTVDYTDEDERDELHGRECRNPNHHHHHGDHGHFSSEETVSRSDTEPLMFSMTDRS